MEITKEFRIQEVRGTIMSNASFQIILEANYFRKEEESSLTMDTKTCARYQIPVSLDLVGRTLICIFQTRELPLRRDGDWKGFVEMKSVEDDNLRIKSLQKKEVILPSFRSMPPLKYNEVSRILKLSSFGEGDGIHPHIMPCPFYRLSVELTEEEYEACKALSASSVFKVNFQLKP